MLKKNKFIKNAKNVIMFYDSSSTISAKSLFRWNNLINPETNIFYVRTKMDLPNQKANEREGEIKLSIKKTASKRGNTPWGPTAR